MISDFRGPYRFLSNFHLAPIEFEGRVYPSTEHAYQAAKVPDDRRELFLSGSCRDAKRLGRTVPLRHDWEEVKDGVMLTICRYKFSRHPALRAALLATGDHELVEGNTWGDTYWGVCNGVGKNRLGQILTQIRAELRHGSAGE